MEVVAVALVAAVAVVVVEADLLHGAAGNQVGKFCPEAILGGPDSRLPVVDIHLDHYRIESEMDEGPAPAAVVEDRGDHFVVAWKGFHHREPAVA